MLATTVRNSETPDPVLIGLVDQVVPLVISRRRDEALAVLAKMRGNREGPVATVVDDLTAVLSAG